MKARYFGGLIFSVFFAATPTAFESDIKSHFIIWNVGQGQWLTWVTQEACLHFDLGGEHMPEKKIKSLCQFKENKLFLSHWDWDHISFVKKISRLVTFPCLAVRPTGKSSPFKMKIIDAVPDCRSSSGSVLSVSEKLQAQNSNDRSHVLVVKKKFLVPGDSTTSQEKIWSKNQILRSISILILGHHGSRTSTSEALLKATPQLKLAVASARYKRYGHPHAEVELRLKNHQVPLLKTEDWGNIWLEDP